MAGIRIIPRLDIKGPKLIKGIHLEGLRVVGDPHAFALDYYGQGADELVFMDIVASLYQRNNLADIIQRAADQIYVPITVGGGIRSLEDVRTMLHSGADKVAINTAAVARPALITEVAQRFGSQCMVLSVEAKRKSGGGWEAFVDNGREHTGLDVVEWVERAVALGAGEIMLTSVDQEGTRRGFDVDLVRTVAGCVRVPIIASGGYGCPSDLKQAADAGACGLAIADALHWRRAGVAELKAHARAAGLEVRL
ncbi:imidazole glycerol phosphate synthase subunit HisF [Verminephrobacter aporrectodeae]|uniref:imidazole glycerol-phosphate synthase n=1 Tax=Verminephrobacter aporrectodeae subsp. tuberculatae TaxID=1110392 RepID=A0ABT3KNV9_9BURK|nr:imidazole glycerol phosphate synthase cyclase subunit [Verminephrobacter aporrectodeae]MCW5221410.1 imidazole glycerol phosphate synthase subunit HisF [Verminephrobacter aporrectodeae subsp. tuberculatae]MCW5257720.1 imidazole glycerol phosphate synthase subunit HisF [Verminephrobacter aporrectodeae subsp. tuberculatae]MCW5290701.1 imidazole glycerol phosphate synthase subunit HisF [Verminephrobacter aporrectodeae subsp. tuberculatae]MCW5320006.1 imidazole glycerol phosphate synthase subunit